MSSLKPATVKIVQILHKSLRHEWGYIGLGSDNKLYAWTDKGNWVELWEEPEL